MVFDDTGTSAGGNVKVFTQWPIYFIGRMLPAAIGFGGIAIYTRVLDPANFGTYALLLSMSFFIGTTGFSWLRIATLRMMATVEDSEEADYGVTILCSFAMTALIVAAVIFIVLAIYEPTLPTALKALTAATAIASGWFELNITMSQARLKLMVMTFLAVARATLTLASSLIFVSMGFKAAALLGGFVVGNCSGFGALSLWAAARRGSFRNDIFLRMLRFGWPSSAGALSQFSATFQRYLLAAVGGNAVVGVYAATNDFSQQTVGLLVGTATLAGQPLAYRARDMGSEGDLIEQMRNNARLIFAIGLGSAVGLIVLSGPLSHVYLGSRFQVDAQALIALSALMVFIASFRANYFEQAFEIALDTRPMAIITALRIALAVLLSVLLIGKFGSVGASVALLGAEIIGILVSVIWARRVMAIPIPIGSFAKITVAAATMAGVILLLPDRNTLLGLSLAIVVGVIVFFSTLAGLHPRQVRELLLRMRVSPALSSRV